MYTVRYSCAHLIYLCGHHFSLWAAADFVAKGFPRAFNSLRNHATKFIFR